mmetsp:Transcript_5670/g.6181  ORF Transcript_5670/g.6181 Transcript_5670/m.6181 type:complete len:102 (+) Transcript_5670:130-435(+)
MLPSRISFSVVRMIFSLFLMDVCLIEDFEVGNRLEVDFGADRIKVELREEGHGYHEDRSGNLVYKAPLAALASNDPREAEELDHRGVEEGAGKVDSDHKHL